MDMKSSDCNVAKRQKIEPCTLTKQGASSQTSCIDLVLFNTDSLFKITSYLPATDLLNLALTCRRYGMAAESDNNISGDESLSLIEETTRRIVQDITITTGEERPKIEGEGWLANYHYLRSVVIFDQLGGNFHYVSGNKSHIVRVSDLRDWSTACSNNIMKTGRHFVSLKPSVNTILLAGVMRPGNMVSRTKNINPIHPDFFQIYSQSTESLVYNTNNSIHCCMYYEYDGSSHSRNWRGVAVDNSTRDDTWRESFTPTRGGEVGMLLDLDEGTLSIYKNGQRLGVVKRGLAGHYCWAVSVMDGDYVTIKRGPVPSN